ncbi:BTAD domain-containing putative transcriptional regulator [Actinospongicola halichondriae]|uniref:BTAD domain-containing putative transcriptional regulator n=1 Tax=Actinospongicola halichondriae TaxID=3236844 RepID=UPI003D5B62B8
MADLSRVGGASSSRHEPTRLAATTLLRGRLVGLLRGRFERRLTVIEAGAGFGKSTLLSQVVRENRIEQHGVDALLRVADTDRDPALLLAGLGAALGITEGVITVDRVADAVWALAPASVAVVIDDVHRLVDAEEACDVLRQLLDRLPSNGHLVVSGRQVPALPIARLLSQDEAVVVTEADLSFTDDELVDMAELRSIPRELVGELPRWPALATLVSAAGRSASIDYVWDEVLRALPDDRRRLLAAVVPFGEVDDDLVRALGGELSAEELVEGVPLVEASEDGSFRLHDLWVDALARTLDDEERNAGLRVGGAMLLARGDVGRAAEAFALAGDEDGLTDVILAIARRPTITADIPEINRVYALLPESMHRRPGARYLEAARHFATDDLQAAAVFAQAAEQARRSGEVEIELLSHWRCTQIADLDIPGGPDLPARVAQLADDGVPLARGIRSFIESRRSQREGDPHVAIGLMGGLDGFEPEQRAISVAIRFVDLGRPEALNASLDEVLASGISDVYAAQAVWMQGQIDPVDAWPFARELPERAKSIPLATATSLRSVVIAMGVAAGAHEEVVALSETNRRAARSTVRLNELFARVAGGLVELVTVDEDTAVTTFARLLDEVPVGRWPERPYLYALAVIRGLLPGGEVLDECDFGPSMTVAVEAGAALAALRSGDAAPAAELPWQSSTLLRVHVPPPLLAELALAAGAVPEAAEVLLSLPHLRTWLRRIADRAPVGGPAGNRLAKAAATRVQAMPSRPPFDVAIDLLGGLALRRSDGRSVDGWSRRERVRHLLAFVALGRDVARSEVAAELWPDLSDEKAAANLRVNLHHLQQALQPDRGDDPPWFLQTDNARLRLVHDGVVVDTELVDAAMVAAVRAESAGIPSEALTNYERVAELTVGDLLPEVSADWVVFERMRLRSIAHAAASRQGELVLARGEPEAAMAIAARAQRLDPLSERAHRLSIRCHLALGSTGAARDAAKLARETMLDAGIALERETEVLLAQLDV